MSLLVQKLQSLINYVDSVPTNQKKTMSEEKEQIQSSNKPKTFKKLLMIPGPTEFDDEIYTTLAQKTRSHVDPVFIKEFGNCLKLTRTVLCANAKCQPFILSGGGSLGWDCIASSLCCSETNDKVLVLNTGYFGDNFTNCLKSYKINVDELVADVGDTIDFNELKNMLKKTKDKPYKMVAITHVDTSTGVCNDVSLISKIVHDLSPNTLIAIDGVCSFAAEKFYFSKWGIDICMTASQKAFGCPPGLAILMVSERGMKIAKKQEKYIHSWYANLVRWTPIMQAYENGKVAYFSTPNVNLVQAMEVSLKGLVKEGIENVFKRHYKYSFAFKSALKALGLKFVPKTDKVQSCTLSAIRYPNGVNPIKFRTFCKEKNCIFAGGLHKKIKNEYFRVGHMGTSTKQHRKDMLQCVIAIEYAMEQSKVKGYKKSTGVAAFNKALSDYSKL